MARNRRRDRPRRGPAAADAFPVDSSDDAPGPAHWWVHFHEAVAIGADRAVVESLLVHVGLRPVELDRPGGIDDLEPDEVALAAEHGRVTAAAAVGVLVGATDAPGIDSGRGHGDAIELAPPSPESLLTISHPILRASE